MATTLAINNIIPVGMSFNNGTSNTDINGAALNGIEIFTAVDTFISKDFNFLGPTVFNITALQSIALKPGNYKFECWGGTNGTESQGFAVYGGYSYLLLTLSSTTIFYIIVGGGGTFNTNSNSYYGGHNGGGDGGRVSGTNAKPGCSGGGATHIAVRTGLLKDLESYKTDIYLVAGGAGGYQNSNSYGQGGGNNGGDGGIGKGGSLNGAGGKGGTQSAGGTGGVAGGPNGFNGNVGSFGKGGDGNVIIISPVLPCGAGGGGGWYGGGSGGSSGNSGINAGEGGGGGGGSGYFNTLKGTGATYRSNEAGWITKPTTDIHGFARIYKV